MNHVSIGIPYTDQGEELALAIESVLAQTHQDWELLLVGDGPSAKSSAIVSQYNDPRIRVFESDKRVGLAATLNKVAHLAKYPILARMDGDDVMHPQRIARQKEALDSDPDLDLVGSHAYLIDEDCLLIGKFLEPELPTSGAGYLRSNAFSHPTVMGRTEWFRSHPYDENLLRGQDKELWLRTWSNSRFLKLPDRLLFYRVPRSMSSKRLRRNEAYNRKILKMYAHLEPSYASKFKRTLSSFAKEIVLLGGDMPVVAEALYARKWAPLEEIEFQQASLYLKSLADSLVSSEDDPTRVTALTVTYGNRFELLERAVESAFKAGAARMIIVDNGSTQQSSAKIDALAAGNARIVVIRNVENEGSAPAFGKGMQHFVDQMNDDYLWMLDDDNLPAEDALKELLHVLKKREATLGPSLPCATAAVRPANTRHAAFLEGRTASFLYPPVGSFMYFDLLSRILTKFPTAKKTPATRRVPFAEIPYAPYGGLLLSRATIKLIGYPKKDLVLYEDDTEYTSRIPEMGGSLLLCRAASVEDIDAKWSNGAGSSGLKGLILADNENRTYFSVRNRVMFDSSQARGAYKRIQLQLNRWIFLIVAAGYAIRTRRLAQYRLIHRAASDALDTNGNRPVNAARHPVL